MIGIDLHIFIRVKVEQRLAIQLIRFEQCLHIRIRKQCWGKWLIKIGHTDIFWRDLGIKQYY